MRADHIDLCGGDAKFPARGERGAGEQFAQQKIKLADILRVHQPSFAYLQYRFSHSPGEGKRRKIFKRRFSPGQAHERHVNPVR
jgi:hypothetical protein